MNERILRQNWLQRGPVFVQLGVNVGDDLADVGLGLTKSYPVRN
jgi:hypothetical protein